MNLREYQKEAVNKIKQAIQNGDKKIRVVMATGTGKSDIIPYVAHEYVARKKQVLIIVGYRILCEQFQDTFVEHGMQMSICNRCEEYVNQDVLIATYSDVTRNMMGIANHFHMIIYYDIDIEQKRLEDIEIQDDTGVCIEIASSVKETSGLKPIYQYTLDDALREGYSHQNTEYDRIKEFCRHLLARRGLGSSLELPKRDLRPDYVIEKDGISYIIDVKTYKNSHVSSYSLDAALTQAKEYAKESVPYLFMFCKVDETVKQNVYKEHGVFIIDIDNFKYLCKDDRELYKELLEAVPFSVTSEDAQQLPKEDKLLSFSTHISESAIEADVFDEYVTRIRNCDPGRTNKADKEYEKICEDILKAVFGTDFDRMQRQLETTDRGLRMDLVCSIKLECGDNFWGFLKQFYSTNYVVFEFKNYSSEVRQDVIRDTEKYLSPFALRRVAFIISRKGFHENAKKAATYSLKNNGNLIIGLTDDDLIRMLSIKKDGRDASGYLMDLVNDFLMHMD